MIRLAILITLGLFNSMFPGCAQVHFNIGGSYTQMRPVGNNATAGSLHLLQGWSTTIGIRYKGITAGVWSDRSSADNRSDSVGLLPGRWSRFSLRSISIGYERKLLSGLSFGLNYSLTRPKLISGTVFTGGSHGPGCTINYDPCSKGEAPYLFATVNYQRGLFDNLLAPDDVRRYYQRFDAFIFRLGTGVRLSWGVTTDKLAP